MKTLQSTVAFQGPTGTVAANGFLALTLAQNCEIIAGGGIVYANIPVFIALDATGKISGSPTIWANDELTPSTSYSVQLQDSNHSNLGNIGPWVISGASPIDTSQFVPQNVTPSFSGAVLLNPAAAQTISGFGLTLASTVPLTVQGNETIAGTLGVTGVTTVTSALANDGVSPTTPTYSFTSSTNTGFFQFAGGNVGISTTGVGRMQWISTGVFLPAGLPFGWESGILNSAVDTGFSRTAAATVALGVGTQGDKTGILQLAAIQGPGLQFQKFSASGTFTIPAGITQVKFTLVGGGGAGGGSTNTNNGSGGGSGASAIKYLTGLTPGNTITVTVGTGGAGVSGAGGNNGNDTTITSGTQAITTVTAGKGFGGTTTGVIQGGGNGGTATNGDRNYTGNAGGLTLVAGAGGEGGPSIYGGATGPGNPGSAGTAAGAGGSGCNSGATSTGGAGANGEVLAEWIN